MALSNLIPDRIHLDGRIHPDFQGVEWALREQLRNYPGGAAVCVYHRGEKVVDIWGGTRNEEGERWQQDTMAPSYSTTKGIAATLLHIYADRGLIDYDARVADYWPEFGKAGKEDITVRQVLCHQSGLYHVRQMIDHVDRLLDWDHMIEAIENAEPVHAPGARTGYHGLTFGFLVGEIIQRVTGQKFSRLVQNDIVKPLKLDGLFIGAPEKVLHRSAQLLYPDSSGKQGRPWLNRQLRLQTRNVGRAMQALGIGPDMQSFVDALAPRGISRFDFGSPESLRASIPAANGLFTARSLAKLYATLAAGGELEGTRLLSAATLEKATTRQRHTGRYNVIPFDMRWRMGYHGVPTLFGFLKNGFGHFGYGGSGAWGDSKRDLSVALIVNSGMGTPFGDTRITRITGAALACAEYHNFGRTRPRKHGLLAEA